MCHIVQILSHKFRALLCHFILCWTYSTIKTKEKRQGFFWLFNHSMQEKYRTLGAYMRPQTPLRALLFTHSTIKWPIPSSRSSN